ncbi:hypothetical protein [Kistimonas scapharcae]
MPSISALIRNNRPPYGIGTPKNFDDTSHRVAVVDAASIKQHPDCQCPQKSLKDFKLSKTPAKKDLTVKAVKYNDQLRKTQNAGEFIKQFQKMTRSGFTPSPKIVEKKCNEFVTNASNSREMMGALLELQNHDLVPTQGVVERKSHEFFTNASTRREMMDTLLELQNHNLLPDESVLNNVYCSMTQDEIIDSLLGSGVRLESFKQLPGATLDDFVNDSSKLQTLVLGLNNTVQTISFNIRMDLLKSDQLAQSFGLDSAQARSELSSKFEVNKDDAQDLKEQSLKVSRTSRDTFGVEAQEIAESLLKKTVGEMLSAFAYSAKGIKVRQQALDTIRYNIDTVVPTIKAASQFANRFGDETLLNPLDKRSIKNLTTLMQAATEHSIALASLKEDQLATITRNEKTEFGDKLTKIKNKLSLEFIHRYVDQFPAAKTLLKASDRKLHRHLDQISLHCRTLEDIDTVPQETIQKHLDALLQCRDVIWGILDDRGEYCV